MTETFRFMPSRPKIKLLLLLVVGWAAVVTWLEISRQQHVRELAQLRSQARALIRPRSESKSTSEVTVRGTVTGSEVGLGFAAERQRAQEEIVRLEHQALVRRAEMLTESERRKAADVFALTSDNRDPDQGLAKLEYFKDVGRETPRAALQTLVWALLKGENASFVSGFVVEGRARERAEVLLRSLPKDEKRLASCEQLAAWWFTSTLLDVPAMNIVDDVMEDATHATLIVRSGVGNERKVSMQLGSVGWQIVVPEHAMEGVQKTITGASSPLPEK